MGTIEFENAWSKLSEIQKQAAEWDQGPLIVLAGPGSGKTRVLTCRIAHIIEKSVGQNYRILGLTFTNKAADEMRSRVNDFVPGQEDRFFLSTFHSFCADVLRQHGIHLGINPNFSIYSQDVDLQAVLDEAVNQAMRENDLITENEKKAMPVIQRLKAFLVFPDQSEKVFRDPISGKRFAIVYDAYERELAKRNALDFNSLLIKTYELFTKFPVLAKRYRTVFPYICVDEFQDTNEAQYSVIRALVGIDYKNLFVVADDDQIIYQWNGASYKRIEQFVDEFKPQVIQLPVNYRCPAEIVKLANNLISHNFYRSQAKKQSTAFRKEIKGDVVRVLSGFPDEISEAEAIVEDVINHQRNKLGELVILARSRKLLNTVLKSFGGHSIPAIIAQRKDNFESTPFVWLTSILSLANDRQDRRKLDAVCGTFNQLAHVKIDSGNVEAQADLSNRDLLQHWVLIALDKITDLSAKKVVSSVSKNLVDSRDFQKFCNDVFEWFEKLVKLEMESGIDPYLEVFARYEEEKSVWDELIREIIETLHGSFSLDAFLQELQMRSKEPTPQKNTVVLMTIHGAKGKEFKHVYLSGMVEDELPSFQSKQKGDKSPEMEEERRNCFVAITRTLESLTLSFADSYRGWQKQPSRFLYEMGVLIDNELEDIVPF